MARVTRRCSQCGSFDPRESWSSIDEATKSGAIEKAWACSTCAWTEFDLVERETETAKEPVSQR